MYVQRSRGSRQVCWLALAAALFTLSALASAQAQLAGESGGTVACDAECRAQLAVCGATKAHWTLVRAELTERIVRGRRELEAWETGRQKAEEEQGWFGSLMEALFGSDMRPHAGPVGARVNQDIGARECVDNVLATCETMARDRLMSIGDSGVIADGDRDDGAFRSAYSAYARELAQRFQRIADEQFELSLQRKRMLESSPSDYRLAAEANQMIGYADTCRAAASRLEGLRLADPAPKPSPDVEVGDACGQRLLENRYFCFIQPGDDVDETYERDFKDCCVPDPAPE